MYTKNTDKKVNTEKDKAKVKRKEASSWESW
jgi:hypothetical protein